jgi:hypothetical protein
MPERALVEEVEVVGGDAVGWRVHHDGLAIG